MSEESDEFVLMNFPTVTDYLVLSGLEMDHRDFDQKGLNLVWQAPPRAGLIAPKGYEFVIRSEGGTIKVLRRKTA